MNTRVSHTQRSAHTSVVRRPMIGRYSELCMEITVFCKRRMRMGPILQESPCFKVVDVLFSKRTYSRILRYPSETSAIFHDSNITFSKHLKRSSIAAIFPLFGFVFIYRIYSCISPVFFTKITLGKLTPWAYTRDTIKKFF